jgi:hypothetical protein
VPLYALVEAADPETIDLFLTHDEVERAGANRVDQGSRVREVRSGLSDLRNGLRQYRVAWTRQSWD